MNFKKIRTMLFAAFLCTLSFTQVHAASYTVKPGDSLFKIGVLFKTTAASIINDNGLSGNSIYPGQALYVNSKTYTVQASDTLYLIAKKFGISVDTLIAANSNVSSYIYPGQVLNIPAGYVFNGTTSSKYIISCTDSEVDLLARLVTAEAESEPYTAKVAVAASVINRVQSPQFPSTLKGVIYQVSNGYYQFTPVLNGWINKPASDSSRKAALEALYGSDPTKGAIYYFDDSTTNTWLWSKPIALRVGKLVFTY
ncbi:LysM peptidoglycan-binding domain-containing protein [Clostridium autoethanogenum]|uniref:LysM peptidoglycan-binding domain-containing protein n=2 Tax=Clostridium autoethanogenum TaxID=84023 RepID=A0A3M0S6A9_9CLOT|nr:LysM peptidoglycan-binding domain-containing protein [Clostridium autoethanogenum]AGY76747.1 LysM peptidoglycan-binding domain-containing protein [Clostridium autoethanogenum DSM 10061]ALU36901.1 Cell wall hydrolase [Clostridium autoethanogenum DSM 10061]OVY50409.1 Spore cortex-lytic enzyme precursor [Clostridium autoethanogenum]RMC94062.1 LysM peptidoglycan-binding domain-containing protein [Clostridium autoethanogenum]